jgi:hypothetical protein
MEREEDNLQPGYVLGGLYSRYTILSLIKNESPFCDVYSNHIKWRGV